MNLKGITTRIFGALMVLTFAGATFAQEMSVGTASGQPGGQATTSVDWTGDGSVDNITVWFEFDETVITPEVTGTNNDVVGCLDGMPASHTGILTTCRNPAATPGRIVLVISDQAGAGSFPTTNVGTFTFNIAGGATTGTTEPITVSIQEATTSDLTDVTGTVAASDGSVDIVSGPQPDLEFTPADTSTISFGNVENGESATDSVQVCNTVSGDSGSVIDSISATVNTGGPEFTVDDSGCASASLSPGDCCTVDAAFTPSSGGGTAFTGDMTISTSAGDGNFNLEGTGVDGPGASLNIQEAGHNYGQLLTNDESASFTFTVVNDGEAGSNLAIDAIAISGGDYSVTGGSCDAGVTELGQNETCTIDVEFAPTADGIQAETLTVDGTDTINTVSMQDTASLDGEGVSEPRFSSNPGPGTVSLGSVEPGGSLDTDVVITNEGNQALDASCGSLTDPDGVFTLTPDPANFTGIAAGGSESFNVACDVPDVASYEATMQCTTNEGEQGMTYDYTFRCSGQPLVIPTMQPWGLILLSLMMLAIGGFSIRFFRAG